MRILAISWSVCSFVFFSFSSYRAHAQSTYPAGVYTSLDDLQWKTPSLDTKAKAELRYGSSVYMLGGNDYNVFSNGVLKREIRQDWMAFSDGEHLYLNGHTLGLQSHFTKVLAEGEYLFFNAAINENTVSSIVIPTAILFGLVGGVISHWIIAGRRRSYVLDRTTGRTTLLKPKSMGQLLANDLDLQTDYQNEEDQKRRVIMREYIAKLNDRVAQRKSEEKRSLNIDDSLFIKHVNLIMYRNKAKQKDESLYITISDGVSREVPMNSIIRLNLVYSGNPIKLCVSDSSSCVYLDYSDVTTHYLNCSLTSKSEVAILEIEDDYLGEIHSEAARKAQRKREKRAVKAN